MPFAVAASAGREPSTLPSLVIQKVLSAGGSDSSGAGVSWCDDTCAAKAARRSARSASFCSSGSIFLTEVFATVAAVSRATAASCRTLRAIIRDPAISTTANTTTVGTQRRLLWRGHVITLRKYVPIGIFILPSRWLTMVAEVKNIIERNRDPVAAREILVVNDQSQVAAPVRQRFGHTDT